MKTFLFPELNKIKHYRIFNVLIIIYITIQLVLCSSWQYYIEVLAKNTYNKHISNLLQNFRLYHFHDIWHNLTYVSGYFKFVLAVFVLTSICNEYSYRTLRQNIIDGMSRFDFLLSKIGLVIMLSTGSALLIFLQGTVLGLIYTPANDYHYFFWDFEFVFAFFLESVFFYMLSLLVGITVKRTGLSMILLFVYTYIAEPVLALNLPDKINGFKEFLPIGAMNNLNEFPFKKYAMMMSKEYIAIADIFVVSGYILLFAGLSYLVLHKRDL